MSAAPTIRLKEPPRGWQVPSVHIVPLTSRVQSLMALHLFEFGSTACHGLVRAIGHCAHCPQDSRCPRPENRDLRRLCSSNSCQKGLNACYPQNARQDPERCSARAAMTDDALSTIPTNHCSIAKSMGLCSHSDIPIAKSNLSEGLEGADSVGETSISLEFWHKCDDVEQPR